jgi:DNA-binding CsgD family transcriptional regulator
MNEKILEYIGQKGQVSPNEIAEKFSISRQMSHWHLLRLQKVNRK